MLAFELLTLGMKRGVGVSPPGSRYLQGWGTALRSHTVERVVTFSGFIQNQRPPRRPGHPLLCGGLSDIY